MAEEVIAPEIMNTTESAALLRTEQFPTEWPEEGEEAPSGFDFALSLFREFKSAGAVLFTDELGEDSWEHQNWFFRMEWEGEDYNFRIENSVLDADGTLWFVGITRAFGTLKAMRSSHEEKEVVSQALRDTTDRLLKAIAKPSELSWMTHGQALDILYETNS